MIVPEIDQITYRTVTVFDILNEDGVDREDVSRLIQCISDICEEYYVDCNILNKIMEIILKFEPSKEDLCYLNIENLNKLLEIVK